MGWEDMIWALQRQDLPFPETLLCTEVVCVAAELGLLSKHREVLVDLGGPGQRPTLSTLGWLLA